MANGHVHLRAVRVEGPVVQVSCAALVEPPFEVTFLDIEPEGDRVEIRRESALLVPSLTIRPPAFSPPEQGWAFKAGAWHAMDPLRRGYRG